jgi:hypothetical protein
MYTHLYFATLIVVDVKHVKGGGGWVGHVFCTQLGWAMFLQRMGVLPSCNSILLAPHELCLAEDCQTGEEQILPSLFLS